MHHQSKILKQSSPTRASTPMTQTPTHEQSKPAEFLPLVPGWTPQHMLSLQRLIGNRAINRALNRAPLRIQRTLEEDLSTVLIDTSPQQVSLYQRLRKVIDDFNNSGVDNKTQERRTAYAQLKQAISSSDALETQEKTILIGLLLEDSLEWKNTDESKNIRNHFSSYFLHDDDNADLEADLNASSLNCWETVLFLAYKANAMSRGQVKDLHNRTPHLAKNAVWNFLGYSESEGRFTDEDIEELIVNPGQIIFYSVDKKKTHVAHVGLALGGNKMLSLWNEPNGITKLQQISIGSVIGENFVSIANPPWMGGSVSEAINEAYETSTAKLNKQIDKDVEMFFKSDDDDNLIPYLPKEENKLSELRETIKKIMMSMMKEKGDYNNYAVANKLRESHEEYFVDPNKKIIAKQTDSIVTVLSKRLSNDVHQYLEKDVEGELKNNEAKDVIRVMLEMYDSFLVDEKTALEIQSEEALKEYNELIG